MRGSAWYLRGAGLMNAKRALRAAVLLAICAIIVLTAVQPAAWIVLLLLGSLAMAALYTAARMNSRYDPLDPRFGSCIPPISTKPKDRI